MIVLFLILSQMVFAEGPRPEVTIRPEIRVSADMPIKLKDIAGLSYVKAEVMKVAGDLIIYDSAKSVDAKVAGSELVKTVKRRLLSHPDTSLVAWTYFVPETVSFTISAMYLPPQSISFDLQRAVQEKCLDCDVSIRDLRIPQVQGGSKLISFDLGLEAVRGPGSILVPIKVVTDRGQKAYWVSGIAKAVKQVHVTTRRIDRNARIKEEDLKLELTDVTLMTDRPVDKSELIGKQVSRPLQMGKPIFQSDILREVAVRRGQEVKAILSNDFFEVTSQALAEDQGYIGDVIKVRNPDTKKVLSGRIILNGVVKVE